MTFKGETDITSEYAASAFVWMRDTGNAAADATWNAAHNGVKQFTMNAADLTENVKITCTLTGTSPDYGTVYVDENMNLIHAPAEADAEDTLHLENGILSVETEGNEYRLNGNVLGVIRHRLNGSVTAEAWVYAAAPEKLVEFKYDSHGLRTQKKVTDHGQTVTTDYIYHGKKLVGLTCGNDTLHFFYDAQGRPAEVECNGNVYVYINNWQGDIVGISDSTGNYIIKYRYDAWGDVFESMLCSQSSVVANSPFRYRGYVFDAETGLSYLSARYYSHRLGRFIQADLYLGGIAGLLEHNIVAYCKNEPIMHFDPDGCVTQDLAKSLEEWGRSVGNPYIAIACVILATVGKLLLESATSTTSSSATFQEPKKYKYGIAFGDGPVIDFGALTLYEAQNVVIAGELTKKNVLKNSMKI